jgi:hypothetical protein
MKLLWCIQCEQIVPVEEPIEGHSIIQFVPDAGEQEIFWCEGEFTSSAPVMSDDWDLQDEPSNEELAEMNLHAEEMLNDFEG